MTRHSHPYRIPAAGSGGWLDLLRLLLCLAVLRRGLRHGPLSLGRRGLAQARGLQHLHQECVDGRVSDQLEEEEVFKALEANGAQGGQAKQQLGKPG